MNYTRKNYTMDKNKCWISERDFLRAAAKSPLSYWQFSLLRHSICTDHFVNPLAPDTHTHTHIYIYICHTAQLTSRRCILNVYSTNILTEYFKHAAHSPFFFSSRCRLFHNATFFGSCNIHILNTGRAKILKKIPVPKG
jgi:hypothetical protein